MYRRTRLELASLGRIVNVVPMELHRTAPTRGTALGGRATRRFLAVTLGLAALSAIPAAPAQAQSFGSTAPGAGGVIRSQRTTSSLGIGNCPDGSTPLVTTETGCFPADCISVVDLDFGQTGTPAPISVQKFDPALGTLLGVKLKFGAQYVGQFCADNPSLTNCCFLSADRSFIGQLMPVTPGVNVAPPPLAFQGDLTPPPGLFLGTTDAFLLECIGTEMGMPGDPVSCVAGRDHFTQLWNDQIPETEVVIPSTDLAVWVQQSQNPEFVDFMADAIATINTGSCGILDISFDTQGSVFATAEYIYCPNVAPTCVPNAAVVQVDEDGVAMFDLFDYVFDMDGCIDCGSFGIVTPPANGQLNLPSASGLGNNAMLGAPGCNTCGSFVVTYTPNPNFCGPDSFTFTVMDEEGAPTQCSVIINVNPINDPPECNTPAQPLRTNEDTPIDINFCDFVTDIDELNDCGDGINCNSIGTPVSDCGGTFTSLGGGSYRFTPPMDFCGMCTITFSASDSGTPPLSTGDCQVIINVNPVNDPPLCNTPGGPPITILEDETLVLTLSDYVIDPDAGNMCGGADLDCNTLTFSTSSPQLVVTAGPGPCQVTVGGLPGQCGGPFTLFFNISDSAGAPIAQDCQLRFRIAPVNDPPICNPNPPPLGVNEDTPVTFNICDYVVDPDGKTGCGGDIDPDTLSAFSASCGGLIEPLGGCLVRYTPPENFCGACSIDFTICDEGGECVSCTINFTVRPVNDRPECVAGPMVPAIVENGNAVIDFTRYVTDIDEKNNCGSGIDVGTITPMSDCGGTFDPLGGGVFRFTPPPGFCGPCLITFTVSDSGSPPLSVLQPCPIPIQVLGNNDPPVAVDDMATTDEDTPVVIDVIGNDSDPDDGGPEGCGCMLDSSTIEITGFDPACSQGEPAVVFNNQLGRFAVRFNPAPDYCGPCIFTYRVSDTDGRGEVCSTSNEATVTVTINPVNDPPVAVDDSATTYVGEPVLIDLCANDFDIDDETGCGCTLDCSTIMILDDPECGTMELDPGGTGQWIFTPAPDFEGECCFTYRIFDTDGGGNLCDFDDAEVCIDVKPVPCIVTNHRNPSSLLLYPEFDNREGMLTIHTVTNSSFTQGIRVKLEYVDGTNCARADRSVELTPNDTFTFVTSAYIAEQTHGYAYMYATCNQTGPAVVFNHLIGGVLVLDGYDGIAYSLNAIGFRGIGMDAEGNTAGNGPCGFPLTDLNGNGHRDLDNVEYEPVPDEILIPRFIGQTEERQSELILINLTGGKQFTTTLDFLVYNDNEEVFSSQHTFFCWERTPLQSITNLFLNNYLKNGTNHDPEEILGDPTVESGWIRIDGGTANSTSTSIEDPAFYAILVEKNAEDQMAADLPWNTCSQFNGRLLPNTLSGD